MLELERLDSTSAEARAILLRLNDHLIAMRNVLGGTP